MSRMKLRTQIYITALCNSFSSVLAPRNEASDRPRNACIGVFLNVARCRWIVLTILFENAGDYGCYGNGTQGRGRRRFPERGITCGEREREIPGRR